MTAFTGLMVSDIQIASGRVPDIYPVQKFGLNRDVDSGTSLQDVWEGGGVWVEPTEPRIHAIASTSANDTELGTGMRSIIITGLASFDDIEETMETIVLNGTTPVNTVNEYAIIYRMYGDHWGDGGLNAGDITATAATDGTVTAIVTAGDNQTLMAIYATGNYYAHMTNGFANIMRQGQTSGAMIEGKLLTKYKGNGGDEGWLTKHVFSVCVVGTSAIFHDFKPYKTIPPKTLVKVQITYSSDSNVRLSAGFGAYADKRASE